MKKEIHPKLIDIPKDILKPLKILAVQEDLDLKNYITTLLVDHVEANTHRLPKLNCNKNNKIEG